MSKTIIENENIISLDIPLRLVIHPSWFSPGFKQTIKNELEKKYLNKAYSIFYIKEFIDIIDDIKLPLINTETKELNLNILCKVFKPNINDIYVLNIYIDQNKLYGESEYLLVEFQNTNIQLNIVDDTDKKIEYISFMVDNKKIEIKNRSPQKVKITKIFSSTGLGRIKVYGELIIE